MDDLDTFLRARWAEDEEDALNVIRWRERETWMVEASGDTPQDDHIRRHSPARVLADVAAKRQIIDAYEAATRARDELEPELPAERARARWERAAYDAMVIRDLVKLLAQPYAGHPEFREEWKA